MSLIEEILNSSDYSKTEEEIKTLVTLFFKLFNEVGKKVSEENLVQRYVSLQWDYYNKLVEAGFTKKQAEILLLRVKQGIGEAISTKGRSSNG